MEQFEKPIVEATGGIHIGETFVKSFQASWPFGKIEIYQDSIVLKVQYVPNFILLFFQWIGKFFGMLGAYKDISKEIKLVYTDIKGYNEKNAWIMGYGITIIHTNKQYAPFLQVWISKNKAKTIIGHFNNRGIHKQ
ncbi:MAG: hypothetical protein KAI55_04300 [Candidatus Aenigmarchaeota archaeon]|nr:hypothetical protein [Candidatus Aenigmarchaeota archaeon]